MVHPIWPNNNEGHEPLPAPNVVVARSGARLEELPPQAIKGTGIALHRSVAHRLDERLGRGLHR